jgi:hypothetical protein
MMHGGDGVLGGRKEQGVILMRVMLWMSLPHISVTFLVLRFGGLPWPPQSIAIVVINYKCMGLLLHPKLKQKENTI